MIYFVIYLIIINIAAFASMGIDKAKAKKQAWRIPEKTLFLLAIIGGSLGSFIGMQKFRHKTKHWYFKWGMPAIFVLQVALAVFVYYRMGAKLL